MALFRFTLSKYACNKCGKQVFFHVKKGAKTGIYCSYCGAWLKWVNKDDKNLIIAAIEDLKKEL